MNTMYETIMELPLFKGIGEEQLSLLLEKTKVEFLKFNPGETIAEDNAMVKSIDFILNGHVKQIFSLENYDIRVEEILGHGNVLGATRLFGMHTTYKAKLEAVDKVSVMRINKHEYMNILHSDQIYMLNFVNYLSAASQKLPDFMLRREKNSVVSFIISNLVSTFSSRRSESVAIIGSDYEMANYCGTNAKEFAEWKESSVKNGEIKEIPGGIEIIKKK